MKLNTSCYICFVGHIIIHVNICVYKTKNIILNWFKSVTDNKTGSKVKHVEDIMSEF